MRHSFVLLFLLATLSASGRQNKPNVTSVTRDSLTCNLKKNWRFINGDSVAYATPGYNDSSWIITNPALSIDWETDKQQVTFTGVCWFRLHFHADSTVAGLPLSLAITHLGASEIFVDGKRIASFGKIAGKDNSEYEDPQYIPITLVVQDTGEHVFAVRYANYNAEKNYRLYNKNFVGLRARLGEANNTIISDRVQAIFVTGLLIFLFGIFFALSMIHMFLYLYYRAERSNLFFSIFSLSLGILFLVAFFNRFTSFPSRELNSMYTTLFFSAAACFSLSGFNNELFSKKKLRFRIITALCVIYPVLWITWIDAGIYAIFALLSIVLLESVILVSVAIYKKVKGARIVGTGILFFAIFFLMIIVFSLIIEDFDIDDSTVAGRLFELCAIVAILSMPVSMSVYLAWKFGSINKDLKNQLDQVKLLSEKTLEQEREKKLLLESRKEELEKEVAIRTGEVVFQKQEIEKQHEELKVEKKKSDDLLLNILPSEVAEELKQKGTSEARHFDHVTVLFTDFVNFTIAGERLSPQQLVDELHTCFKAFDNIILKYNIEKIKTIGDAYLAVCGLPVAVEGHALKMARAAVEINGFMARRRQEMGDRTFDIRIGIHSGSVVAGIVGVKKFAYDIWGDTVNTAARMEQNSETGRINISEVTYNLIKDNFECTYRGKINAKNKGDMSMYFIDKEK